MPRSSNRSAAVVQQRTMPHDSLDFFPTPPWATRALFFALKLNSFKFDNKSVWEPGCGRGDMSRVLHDYFDEVYSSDIHDYGYGDVQDFLFNGVDYDPTCIVANPPFNLAQAFIFKALERASDMVAIFARSALAEGKTRYLELYNPIPPALILQFTQRVSCVPGRLDPKASLPTAYSWYIWRKGNLTSKTQFAWIPPCRKNLEMPGDYPDQEQVEPPEPMPMFAEQVA